MYATAGQSQDALAAPGLGKALVVTPTLGRIGLLAYEIAQLTKSGEGMETAFSN